MSSPLPDLDVAYRAARYHVQHEPAFDLVIDRFSPDLERLHAARGVTCSALITACNPKSELVDPHTNEQRMALLHALVLKGAHDSIAGVAVDPSGLWPDEPHLLIPGIALRQALALGRDVQQHAIVFADHDAIPRLHWLT